jgi:cytochrome c oxidase cbb3-type subunit 1
MNPSAPSVLRHSLGWLVAANAVGVLLAVLLLWPEANDALGALTYGRWAPVHHNGQLYGWCALPLVGALLNYFLPANVAGARSTRVGLACWTLGLAFGCVSWLAGDTSGKIFVEWSGAARVVWPLALAALWLLLFAGVWPRRQQFPLRVHTLLALLLAVPFVLWWSASPRVYPSIDPDTGGAPGASLLGSTLGLLAIFGALPWLLRLPRADERRAAHVVFWGALVISFALDALLKRGNVSHRDFGHLAGLATLLLWIPLLVVYARAFVWPAGAERWLRAAFAWWLVLTVTGFLVYLPEIADRIKFTNALVAHAHLAMAGTVTSLNMAILGALAGRDIARRWSFWLWQCGAVVMVVALAVLGWREGVDPGVLYVRGGLADACYGLRLSAGLAMFAASAHWLAANWAHDEK